MNTLHLNNVLICFISTIMISQDHASVTPIRTRLGRSGPHLSIYLRNKNNESPLAYPYLPGARRSSVTAHSSVSLSPPRAPRLSHCASSSVALRARPWHLCHSLPRRLFVHLLSSSHTPLTSPWPLGRMCHGASCLPRPSQGHPWARAVLVVLAHHGSSLAPTPTAEIDRPSLPPMLHMYVLSISRVSDVCCNYFILML
jgi:hypothetical protein